MTYETGRVNQGQFRMGLVSQVRNVPDEII